MMDVEVTALMSADDEAIWKRVGLFNSKVEYTAKQTVKGTFRSAWDPKLPRSLPNLQEENVLATVQLSGAKSKWDSSELLSGKKKRGFGQLDEHYRKEGGIQNVFSRRDQGRLKPWKANKTKQRFVMGSDIGLEDACTMAMCMLVGRLSYRKFCHTPLEDWVASNWKPLLGYSLEVFYLSQGWFGFRCRTSEDASLLLDTLWVVDGGSIMLKRWRINFDPSREYFNSDTFGCYSLVYLFSGGIRGLLWMWLVV
jgi:hypothetical protein